MAIDLEQFHQVFFEESLEGLEAMEHSLLEITPDNVDPEIINTIFRAAHSIKGGSGTFGFEQITDFTHVLETLLDEVRDGSRQITDQIVDLLLKSCDCLRTMVNQLQAKQPIDDTEARPLIAAFEAILAGQETATTPTSPKTAEPATTESTPATTESSATMNAEDYNDLVMASVSTMLNGDNEPAGQAASASPSGNTDTDGRWKIHFVPEPQILLTGNEPNRIFRELASLGNLSVEADTSKLPDFEDLVVDECHLSWTLWMDGEVDKDDILDVFDWVLDECKLEISREGESELSASTTTEQPEPESQQEPQQEQQPSEPAAVTPAPATTTQATTPAQATTATDAQQTAPSTGASASASASSIRVGIDKVDSLINLVGELVITQSMLSQLSSNFEMSDIERLNNGLEQLLQNTKELQESVMRIRMLPISFAFNRFPRMIRDLAAKTGKKVNLIVNGEQTELDKTVMEQIGDPLVHLVRNAIDHGIEPSEERIAQGKPEDGTITLDAYHRGGNIVVEISDDGRGIDPEKIRTKAIEKGIIGGNEELSKSQIYDLLFEPGFSTAAVVSDISGRGVGMDVVRRNIKSLGGRIEVESELGSGSVFRVYLPLTLAILDGQLVRVGDQTYIIPLISIVESLQIKPELVNRASGNTILYRLREDNVPIIPIYQEFNIDADNKELENGLLVVVESAGQKIGLLVDDLLAQQQVVIKSLESNYKRVEGISGATILGDGSVSLIIDIPGLINRVAGGSDPINRSNHTQAA